MHDPAQLIASLCDPRVHGPRCQRTRLLETHISWVILTGEFAYKIKKPVDFGFLDFSTLAQRRFFCHEELRLNQRLAAPLYLSVVPITGTAEQPQLGGAGPVLEYAVKLRQFEESALGDRLAQAGQLQEPLLDDLASTLARFHQNTPRAQTMDDHGTPTAIAAAAEHNFSHVEIAQASAGNDRLDRLRNWTLENARRLAGAFQDRKQKGCVRECHGDLHLGNLVLFEGRLMPFDCIEFSEDLRWIDVISEVAFLLMDLEVNVGTAPAFRLLNRYLEITGDYAGLVLLDFYRVYRAMVRAKIASLSLAHCEALAKDRAERVRLRNAYLDYAERAAQPRKPALIITHGCSGSGKSLLSKGLSGHLPAIRLSSDVERKRLAGLAADARTAAEPLQGIYSIEFTRRTYQHLLDTARTLLESGYNVLVDATFLLQEHRRAQANLAAACGGHFLILDLQADKELLRQRVDARGREGIDPSEADTGVLERQLAYAQALDSDEQAQALAVDASSELNIGEVAAAIRHQLGLDA
jgi:hypothetical protein